MPIAADLAPHLTLPSPPAPGTPGPLVAESWGTLSLSYPREYLALPADEKLLQRVSAISGGEYSPKSLWDPLGEEVPFHRELWPFCLWGAALLLLLDVTLRRVRVFR